MIFTVLAALFYVAAGVMHFVAPRAYLKIMPPYVPYPLAMVYISGVAEIVGGLGLLHPRSRRAAAWFLVALLIAVFPANIHMAIENPIPILLLRLPLQALLIWWLLRCTDTRIRRGEPSASPAPRSAMSR